MGNAMSPSCLQIPSPLIKLYFHDGTRRVLHGKRLAAEILFEFPDCMVCHADSFFIGHPVPALTFDAQLVNGETYFVLPLDSFPLRRPLLASSLPALGGSRLKGAPLNFNSQPPFEYLKDSDGKVLIKVTPQFMIMLMTKDKEVEEHNTTANHGILCSTPELKKQYDHLVGSREQVWSPKLETISEYNARLSPWRSIVLDRKGTRRREVEG